MPYAASAGLLSDVLPIASGTNATTLRQHTLLVAERADCLWPNARRPNLEKSPFQG